MKDTIEIEVSADGSLGMVYQDGIEEFAESIGAEALRTCRVSYVEPEGSHWSVRSATDTELAIRWHQNGREPVVSREGKLMLFESRDVAIQQEIRFLKELRHG
mgnify:CR=1 FL=1